MAFKISRMQIGKNYCAFKQNILERSMSDCRTSASNDFLPIQLATFQPGLMFVSTHTETDNALFAHEATLHF